MSGRVLENDAGFLVSYVQVRPSPPSKLVSLVAQNGDISPQVTAFPFPEWTPVMIVSFQH